MGRHTSVSSAGHGGLFVRHGMAFTAQQNDGLPLEGFEWMQAGRTFLGIYSLFVSCSLSHLLITAGWCGLSPAYLIHHIFMFGKHFREVRTFDPDIPSPAFPSISPPLRSSDRERHLRGTYRIHPPFPPRAALTTHLKALPWRQQLSTLDHDESWIWIWIWICPFSIFLSLPVLLCR
jgi:hypothetical protein